MNGETSICCSLHSVGESSRVTFCRGVGSGGWLIVSSKRRCNDSNSSVVRSKARRPHMRSKPWRRMGLTHAGITHARARAHFAHPSLSQILHRCTLPSALSPRCICNTLIRNPCLLCCLSRENVYESNRTLRPSVRFVVTLFSHHDIQ